MLNHLLLFLIKQAALSEQTILLLLEEIFPAYASGIIALDQIYHLIEDRTYSGGVITQEFSHKGVKYNVSVSPK